MNRLWVRLTCAFIAITLISVILVAVLANSAATDQFQQYLAGQELVNQTSLVGNLGAYYQQHGNWNGVATILEAAGAGTGGSGMMGRGRGSNRGTSLILADASGTVVYGSPAGATLSANQQASALPIRVNGTTVGYLVITTPGRVILNQAQQAFLDQLRRNLVFAALAALGLAITLGLLISRAMARPLAHLSTAARAFARRDWDYRVKPEGTVEVADVARAFNQMAESLQRSERVRREMMADIAHELRTPLAVAQGNLRAMLDGVYPLEHSEVATVYDETLLLNRLIDDLRELALAEAGQLPLSMRDVDATAALRDTVAHFVAVAGAQGVELKMQLADDLPTLRTDPDRLAQVLRNLLMNAVRYTPAGGSVTLKAVRQSGSAQHSGANLEISVVDTGSGITPEDLPYIFDRFYRGDRSRARSSGGTGLGLAIAKTLVEAMGGQMGVESAAGQGSRFWLTLPAI